MLDNEIMSKKWQITASLSNNKTDRYIITNVELVKWITRKRRKIRRDIMQSGVDTPIKPKQHMDAWLIDLAFEKLDEYIKRFKMKDVSIVNMNIESTD